MAVTFPRVGAEAILTEVEYFGKKAVKKERKPKGYRVEELDRMLRTRRIHTEVRLLRAARMAGVDTPAIYDIDIPGAIMVIERIEGSTLKELLGPDREDPEQQNRWCQMAGECVGILHKADIIHGDLTTSNIIVSDKRLYFIDLSLGETNSQIEAKGVDLFAFKKAFSATHSETPHLFEHVLKGYRKVYDRADEVEEKMEEISKRARYMDHVGTT